jgi:hypothetical protein
MKHELNKIKVCSAYQRQVPTRTTMFAKDPLLWLIVTTFKASFGQMYNNYLQINFSLSKRSSLFHLRQF